MYAGCRCVVSGESPKKVGQNVIYRPHLSWFLHGLPFEMSKKDTAENVGHVIRF